ncbi:hypothetical protein [Mesobacillus zeae]|uniref:Uncharacterized protein n=1 Tax=Mesobacillus zeae TaxID=1917180 RepID=A0A398B8A9_9BACI|nr:hypothetical protein [Mesobacillus zeae]RID85068.1 hypothetical protein D1970_10910 [Mesobacillus zeae]
MARTIAEILEGLRQRTPSPEARSCESEEEKYDFPKCKDQTGYKELQDFMEILFLFVTFC